MHSNADLSDIIKSLFLPSVGSSMELELQMGNAGLTPGEVSLAHVRSSSNTIVEIKWGSISICGLELEKLRHRYPSCFAVRKSKGLLARFGVVASSGAQSGSVQSKSGLSSPLPISGVDKGNHFLTWPPLKAPSVALQQAAQATLSTCPDGPHPSSFAFLLESASTPKPNCASEPLLAPCPTFLGPYNCFMPFKEPLPGAAPHFLGPRGRPCPASRSAKGSTFSTCHCASSSQTLSTFCWA